MALGITASVANIKRFAKDDNTLYVKETDSAFSPLTTGDGTIWVCLGTMKGTKLDPQIDEYKDKGDGGKITVFEETIEQFVISTTAMQREKATRQLPVNVKDKYYLIAVKGQTVGTKQEAHLLCGRISQAFSYPIGEVGQMEGLKIVTMNNTATLTATLPTEIGTGTITIPAGQMWATDDI